MTWNVFNMQARGREPSESGENSSRSSILRSRCFPDASGRREAGFRSRSPAVSQGHTMTIMHEKEYFFHQWNLDCNHICLTNR